MADHFKVFLSTLILAMISQCTGRYDGDVEHSLIKHLFSGYLKDARPVFNKSQAVHIKLDIAYSQLVNLDGKKQILSSKVWIRQMWTNPFLTWNPDDYGGLESINVNSKMVWKPDIVLYNNIGIGQTGAMYNFDTKVVINHDGTSSWYAPTQIQSICKIDITYFPFDMQHCKLVFGSWTYTGNALNLLKTRNQSDLSKYTISGEWDLISAPVVRNVVKYACCQHPFIDVTFHIYVRRKVLFYLNNLIFPSIVLTVLTVFSFYLPPESGERVSLVITILLGLTVFMLVFTDSVPNTSEVIPLIAKYTFAVMCEVALSLLVTCFVMRTYHKGHKHDVPIWVRYFVFHFLAPLLRVKLNKDNNNEKTARPKPNPGEKNFQDGMYTFIPPKTRELTPPSICYHRDSAEKIARREKSEENAFILLEEDSNNPHIAHGERLEKLCAGMTAIMQHIKDIDRVEHRKNEWHTVATVLDTAFFWLFLASMIISTLLFYFQIPHNSNPL